MCFACIQSAAIVDVSIKNVNVDVTKLIMSTSTQGVSTNNFFHQLIPQLLCCIDEMKFYNIKTADDTVSTAGSLEPHLSSCVWKYGLLNEDRSQRSA